MLPDYSLTWTRTPRAYATGGHVAVGVAQMDRDPAACHMDAFLCGGPIDAPAHVPAGVVRVSHGVWFMALAPREA